MVVFFFELVGKGVEGVYEVAVFAVEDAAFAEAFVPVCTVGKVGYGGIELEGAEEGCMEGGGKEERHGN